MDATWRQPFATSLSLGPVPATPRAADLPGSAPPSPERLELARQATLDMARRSRSGSWVGVFLLLPLLVFGPPSLVEHPWVTGTFLALWLAALAARLALAGRTERLPEADPRPFRLSLLAAPLLWGAFSAWTVSTYGARWDVAVLVVIGAGIAAGAATSYHPDLRLHGVYQVLMWLPVIGAAASAGHDGRGLGAVTALYLGYMLVQARAQGLRYRQATGDHLLLQRRTAELEERRRIQDEFLAVVTHDLRNSVQSILMSGYILNRSSSDERVQEMARTIQESAKYMIDLTGDLHDLARIGLEGMRLRPVVVDLGELADGVAEEHRESASGAGIVLRREGRASLPLVVDPLRIRQVLSNLVSNAIKYNRRGGHVVLRLEHAEGHAVLEVEDSGLGIAPGEVERIFEAFTRGSSCGSTRGSGLGLAITRRLTELHGGRMEVQSRPGVGSTFRVILPGAEAAAWRG